MMSPLIAFVGFCIASQAVGLRIPCTRNPGTYFINCTIPDAVSRVKITVIGGSGGSVASCNGGPCDELGGAAIQGGGAGLVTALMDVVPGEEILAFIGGDVNCIQIYRPPL